MLFNLFFHFGKSETSLNQKNFLKLNVLKSKNNCTTLNTCALWLVKNNNMVSKYQLYDSIVLVFRTFWYNKDTFIVHTLHVYSVHVYQNIAFAQPFRLIGFSVFCQLMTRACASWDLNIFVLSNWVVCRHFGLFVRILVCLPEFWFLC